jgi:hypothetical protein
MEGYAAITQLDPNLQTHVVVSGLITGLNWT